MRFLTRALLGVFLLAVTAGLLAYAGSIVYGALQARWASEPANRPARERVFAVNVVSVAPGEVTPVLETFGEIRSRRTLELRTSSGGEVVYLSDSFENGGRVAAGELLLRIDPVNAQAALDVTRADLRDAEADLRDAERTLVLAEEDVDAARLQADLRARALTRQRDLLTRGVGTEAAVETAELAVASAGQAVLSRRQALAQAQARLDQAETTLERRQIALSERQLDLDATELRAAFSGVLEDVAIVEGRLVTANERLGALVDPTRLEVAFRISTPQYTRLVAGGGSAIGAPVAASFDLLGVDLIASGRVTRESGSVADGQTGRALFATLDEAAGFRPGDFVTVRMDEPVLRGVAALPAAAVDASGTVLVVGADDRLEVRPVEVLRRQGDEVLVDARAIAGEDVVAARTPLLGAGIKVRVLRPVAAGEAAAEPDMVELDPDRRARLVSFVEGNSRMPADVKARMLDQLSQDKVPAGMVARIEERMGS